MHEIYKSFDNFSTLETRSEFLDMSKAFDKVWHEGLMCKLKTISVSNNLLTLFQSFLDNDVQPLSYQTSSRNYFSRKILKPFHPKVYFNEVPVERSVS